MRQEKQKKDRGEERKRKVKVNTAVSLLNPAYAELRKLIFQAFGSEGREVYDLKNGFMVRFSFL